MKILNFIRLKTHKCVPGKPLYNHWVDGRIYVYSKCPRCIALSQYKKQPK